VRIALGIEYDGAGFTGWQTQPDRRSVQDALEAALALLAQNSISTICAGRTDAGVHAIDQGIVRREFLLRLKQAFDAQHIRQPQMTVLLVGSQVPAGGPLGATRGDVIQ